MDDCSAYRLVSNWGHPLEGAVKSPGMTCASFRGDMSDGCEETYRISMSGNLETIAKSVVGFTKNAPYSNRSDGTLAVICECGGCHGYFWFHITTGIIEIFVKECPAWPVDQKAKFKET